jgi:hypothetical protein
MIAKRLGPPDSIAYGNYAVRHLWNTVRVTAAEATPEFEVLLSKSRDRKARAEALASRTHEQYITDQRTAKEARHSKLITRHGSWRAALALGCEYMFSLNRYVKTKAGFIEKNAIYEMKNDLIRLLYLGGFSTECIIHESVLPKKVCFGCDGSGDYAGEDCYRCDGTGVFLPEKKIEFVAFRFVVDDHRFAWHQPKDFVKFKYSVTGPTSQFALETEEKDVPLAVVEFAKAKELIKWIIGLANAEAFKVAA